MTYYIVMKLEIPTDWTIPNPEIQLLKTTNHKLLAWWLVWWYRFGDIDDYREYTRYLLLSGPEGFQELIRIL